MSKELTVLCTTDRAVTSQMTKPFIKLPWLKLYQDRSSRIWTHPKYLWTYKRTKLQFHKKNKGFDEPPEPISKEPEYGPFEKPRKGGLLAVIKWVIMLPLYALAKITIPDCRKEAWAKSYILTFLMAILWISMYSYLMVRFFYLRNVDVCFDTSFF